MTRKKVVLAQLEKLHNLYVQELFCKIDWFSVRGFASGVASTLNPRTSRVDEQTYPGLAIVMLTL
jgi:hypothetical protein